MDAGYNQVVGVIHDIFGIWVYLGQKRCEAFAMSALREMLSEYAVIIVTGGSSGIGKACIEHVAKLDCGVVICNLSRREPDGFSRELKPRHFRTDLGDPRALAGSAEAVISFLRETAPEGKVMLINNSGFGGYGRVDEIPAGHQLEMIDLNVRAVVDLTARLLPELKRRGGAVINIASAAAFQPTPFMATYGASKAFLLHWSLALGEDLAGAGVRVLAVCPGPTATEFFRRAGLRKGAVGDRWGQSAEAVAEITFDALRKGRRQVVCGWKNQVLTWVSARLPKPLAARWGAAVLARYRMSRVAQTEAAR